ncbi:MAG: OmpA family protein, partial [Bacteroidota bacterium]|nr:OmpA family protein [Bacteroidota bacterium]
YLRANPQAEVRIVGHTDEFGGSFEETQRLSEQRAQQVVEYLVRRGISRSRLLASGVGTRQPVADNRTPEGRLQNRRVEIVVVQ